jgi:hypothetical protein
VQPATGAPAPVQQVPLAHWLSIVQVAPGARLHTPVPLHSVPPLSLQVVN